MAKLVFGNTKQTVVPAVVKEKQPIIDTLNVTPTTSAQTITAPSGTDGYSPVNVSAVDSSIDANIVAGNIKSGVSILGVNGSVVELNGTTTSVTPTTSAQTITPTAPNNGFTEVSVSAVTSAIDANIVAGNIKQGVTILGVAGNYSGITPTGTLPITTNGVYDVSSYANADVQVPTTAPSYYIEKVKDANNILQNSTNIINLNGITGVGAGALAYAYYNVSFPTNTSIDLSSLTTISETFACFRMFQDCSGLTSVDLSNLTTISNTYSCQCMFQGCSGLTSVDLSSLTTISNTYSCQSMFQSCTGLTSIDLSSLTTINNDYTCQEMFRGCTGLTSIDLSSLTTINGQPACPNMFQGCSNLKTVKLNALNIITKQISTSYGQVFNNCSKLESVEFGGLKASTFDSSKNQIAYLFTTNTGSQAPNGCTVHFPSNFDPSDPSHTFDASTLTGYPTFGGSASYIHVAFDLPATE